MGSQEHLRVRVPRDAEADDDDGDRDRDLDLCERQDQDGTPTSGRTMNTWQILWSSKNADRIRATVSVNRQSKAIAASGSS